MCCKKLSVAVGRIKCDFLKKILHVPLKSRVNPHLIRVGHELLHEQLLAVLFAERAGVDDLVLVATVKAEDLKNRIDLPPTNLTLNDAAGVLPGWVLIMPLKRVTDQDRTWL